MKMKVTNYPIQCANPHNIQIFSYLPDFVTDLLILFSPSRMHIVVFVTPSTRASVLIFLRFFDPVRIVYLYAFMHFDFVSIEECVGEGVVKEQEQKKKENGREKGRVFM